MGFLKHLPTKIAFILFTAQGIAEEASVQIPLPNMANEELSIPYTGKPFPSIYTKKNIVYGSLSIAPGAGLSVRTREGSTGTALDYKIGVLPFVFDSVHLFPVLSVDYNYLYYSKDDKNSPYLSYGLGAAYILPYIPLRAGIEFKNGFIDIGAKMVMGLVPSPEIRAGVHF